MALITDYKLILIVFMVMALSILLNITQISDVHASPQFKSTIISGGSDYDISKKGVIAYPDTVTGMSAIARWLTKELNRGAGHWIALPTKGLNKAKVNIEIHDQLVGEKIPYNTHDKRYSESYVIHIGKKIDLYAGGYGGALYGVRTLSTLLGTDGTLEPETLIDYPDYKWRGVYVTLWNLSCGDPYTIDSDGQQKWLSCMEMQMKKWMKSRINCLFIQSKLFFRLNYSDLRLLKHLFEIAREMNIEPIPVVASKLWGIPHDQMKQNAIEGVYHKNVRFHVQSGRLIPADDENKVTLLGWVFKQGPLVNGWHRVAANTKQNESKQRIALDTPAHAKPWKRIVLVKNSSDSLHLPVSPEQYYEFTVTTRSDKPVMLWIVWDEFDGNGKKLLGLHHSPVMLHVKDTWQRRWVPMFMSRQTHALKIRIMANNMGLNTAHVELDKPSIIAMRNRLVNVLVNKETAPIIDSIDHKERYVRGKDYELVHAVIKEWRDYDYKDIEKTQLFVLPGGRIKVGQRLNISYDSLPLEYRAIPRSKYSAASKYAYQEYRRIFNRLKVLVPKFIHISLDEHAGGLNRESRSLRLALCNRDLYIYLINTLDNILHKRGKVKLPMGSKIDGVGMTGTKLIVWDDMLNPWHNGNNTKYQIAFGGLIGSTGLMRNSRCSKNTVLNHSVILSSWWYSDSDSRGVVKYSPLFYKNLGYHYFMSTWYQIHGIEHWISSAKPSLTEGIIATTWDKRYEGVSIAACMGWDRHAGISCARKPD